MHDPMVQAWDVRVPVPKRAFRLPKGPRWEVSRKRYKNPENMGEPMRSWWRPSAYQVAAFGRRIMWTTVVRVWHVEPHGADAFTHCKRDSGWRWHVRHWQVTVPPVAAVLRRFDRCAECGRRLNRASRHSYIDNPNVWHRECLRLRTLRARGENADRFIEHLFHAYRLDRDLTVEEAIESMRGLDGPLWSEKYRLQKRLGWDHNDAGEFVRADEGVAP